MIGVLSPCFISAGIRSQASQPDRPSGAHPKEKMPSMDDSGRLELGLPPVGLYIPRQVARELVTGETVTEEPVLGPFVSCFMACSHSDPICRDTAGTARKYAGRTGYHMMGDLLCFNSRVVIPEQGALRRENCCEDTMMTLVPGTADQQERLNYCNATTIGRASPVMFETMLASVRFVKKTGSHGTSRMASYNPYPYSPDLRRRYPLIVLPIYPPALVLMTAFTIPF